MFDVVTSSTDKLHVILRAAVHKVLRPLVRLLIRNGVDCGSFEEEVRRAYVSVAMTDFSLDNRKPSISRAATLTGLSRKEVSRLAALSSRDEAEEAFERGQNRAASVVAGWVRDTDFQDGRQQPRPLPMEDVASGFPALVKRYGGDVPPRAVLDELVRVGAAELLTDGRARLTARSYLPTRDDAAKIEILGTDTRHLLETIYHNLDHSGVEARYQRKVLYDDVPTEHILAFKQFAAEHCQHLLETFDRELAKVDRSANPEVSGTGRRLVGVGMFYFEEDLGDESSSEAGDPKS